MDLHELVAQAIYLTTHPNEGWPDNPHGGYPEHGRARKEADAAIAKVRAHLVANLPAMRDANGNEWVPWPALMAMLRAPQPPTPAPTPPAPMMRRGTRMALRAKVGRLPL